MKILLLILLVILVFVAGIFMWKKISDARMEKEIEKIKIPDDTFQD
ncbi:MAG: hypothetical protein ACD_79C01243G0007 [uncultured bacterium]|nr:MAG: hypothetical protein ACD_79C01243G0007 [uncultured bacterium]